jgi:hypothetical protein
MLLIEKAVKLMDDFHYNIYREYVQRVVQPPGYALRLLDSLSREVAVTQSTEELCWKVYGEGDQNEEKRTQLLELAAHCFKLTSFLSKNYPNYLNHNITRIQHCFNTGDPSRANLILNMALDLARKIEDRDTEITLLEMLIQQEALQESNQHVQQWYERIQVLLEQKRAINEMLERQHLYFSGKAKQQAGKDITPHLKFLDQFQDIDSLVVSMINQFLYCFILYSTKDKLYFMPATIRRLESLEHTIQSYDYLILPYLFTLNDRVSLIKLYFYRFEGISPNKILKEAKQIAAQNEDILHWSSFISMPQKMSLVAQTSHYLSYHFRSYHFSSKKSLDENILCELQNLQSIFINQLEATDVEKRFTLSYINLSCMYAGLLIVEGGKKIDEGILILESLLTSYQQFPFHLFIDTLYVILIMGYFAKHSYENITEAFYRYNRTTKGKTVNPENDLGIKGLYYLSKWITTERPQYLHKLSKVIRSTKALKFHGTSYLLVEAANYFNAPIQSIDESN